MVGLLATRRGLLSLAIAAPVLGCGWGSSATEGATTRVGAALIAEHGLPAARALFAVNRSRIRGLDAKALSNAAAADFRAGRSLTVGGVLLSQVEAAWCLRHVIEGVGW